MRRWRSVLDFLICVFVQTRYKRFICFIRRSVERFRSSVSRLMRSSRILCIANSLAFFCWNSSDSSIEETTEWCLWWCLWWWWREWEWLVCLISGAYWTHFRGHTWISLGWFSIRVFRADFNSEGFFRFAIWSWVAIESSLSASSWNFFNF